MFQISIIIPTYNRAERLNPLIQKFFELDLPFELVIVDDSEKPFPISRSEKLQYIHRAQKLGVSSARNLGAQLAKGKHLLFFDDDDDFTEEWLPDFLESVEDFPDMVFCDMLRKDPDGSQRIERVELDESNLLVQNIFIPGSWMIKKQVFDDLGGYDEDLHYAENTEFFFRLPQKKLVFKHIPKVNFIYYPSPDGGSKNLKNMVDSILIILDKHDAILSSHVKYLYNQILGVNYMRFKQYHLASAYLWKAFLLKPYKIGTLGRFGISLFPPLAKKLYPLRSIV